MGNKQTLAIKNKLNSLLRRFIDETLTCNDKGIFDSQVSDSYSETKAVTKFTDYMYSIAVGCHHTTGLDVSSSQA